MLSGGERYRAVLSYIGTDFSGWQSQRDARTVQTVLEQALGKFAGSPVRVTAAGRTDAGVHADGQAVHFDLPRGRDPVRIRDGVNALLPRDAKLLSVEAAAPHFDARRDALWKEYLYRWSRAPVIAPKDAPFVAPISPRADTERMRMAADLLPGTRDFRVFAVRLPPSESAIRTLDFARVMESGDEIAVCFRGEGFLRGMVRSICGTLAHVARGLAPPERVAELLRKQDRRLLSAKAQARGLTLVRVFYEDVGRGT